jgi:uncharacterized phage-associated protein
MVPAVRSTLEVALWMHFRAESAGEALAAHKLQRMLYLSQAHYAGEHRGGKLMPATFLATEGGPMEPNIFQLFELGTPANAVADPPASIEDFLMGLWEKYRTKAPDALLDIIRGDAAFALAFKQGPLSEITVDMMTAAYGGGTGQEVKSMPKADADRVYWTNSGKAATKWIPGQKRPKD